MFRSNLESQVATLGLESNVRFLGTLDDVRPLLGAADAVALLSHGEGFPNVLLEGWAMDRPVLVSNHPPYPDVVSDQLGKRVNETNPKEVADGLEQLLESDDDGRVGRFDNMRSNTIVGPVSRRGSFRINQDDTTMGGSVIGKIDAVLPLTVQDVDRAWILLRSLERFGDALGRLWIVTPRKELKVIRSKCRCALDIEFFGDDELVPVWAKAQSVSRGCPPASKLIYGRGIRGWYVQQLVKLAIADRVDTPFFLALDADMFLTRPLYHDDLVQSGKGLWQRGKTTGLVKWNRWAAKVLDLPESPWVSGSLLRCSIGKLFTICGPTFRLRE